MLASTSRSSLKRAHKAICQNISPSVSQTECSAFSKSCQLRHASSRTAQQPKSSLKLEPSRQTDKQSNPASGLRNGPWTFTPDSSYQQVQTRTTLARCNIEIARYAENERFPAALDVAARMKREGVKPDVTTYNNLIQAASVSGLAVESWAILEDMKELGLKPDRTTFNSLIHAQRFKDSQFMWAALDDMVAAGISPAPSTFTIIISRYIADGNLEMALQYLQAMTSRDLVPELAVAQGVITLAADLGHPRLALDLLASFEKESARRLDPAVWMSCMISSAEALYADGVCQCWAVIVQELHLTPDEGLCIEVLHTAARHGLPDLATDVLRVLKVMGAEWHEHHFAPLIEAFCRVNQIKDALATLDIMRSNKIEPVAETSLPIMKAISTDIDTVDATWAIIDEMHKEGRSIDISALNVIIQAALSLGDLQRAVGTYKSFPDYNVRPNLETFDSLLQGCIAASHRELGDKLLGDMKAGKVKPGRKTFESMTLLCLTQDSYEDAFFYLEETKAQGFMPSFDVYAAIVRKCALANDPRQDIALEEMQQCGYNVTEELREVIHAAQAARMAHTRSIVGENIDGAAARFVSVGLDGAAQRFIETGGLGAQRATPGALNDKQESSGARDSGFADGGSSGGEWTMVDPGAHAEGIQDGSIER